MIYRPAPCVLNQTVVDMDASAMMGPYSPQWTSFPWCRHQNSAQNSVPYVFVQDPPQHAFVKLLHIPHLRALSKGREAYDFLSRCILCILIMLFVPQSHADFLTPAFRKSSRIYWQYARHMKHISCVVWVMVFCCIARGSNTSYAYHVQTRTIFSLFLCWFSKYALGSMSCG